MPKTGIVFNDTITKMRGKRKMFNILKSVKPLFKYKFIVIFMSVHSQYKLGTYSTTTTQ